MVCFHAHGVLPCPRCASKPSLPMVCFHVFILPRRWLAPRAAAEVPSWQTPMVDVHQRRGDMGPRICSGAEDSETPPMQCAFPALYMIMASTCMLARALNVRVGAGDHESLKLTASAA